MSGSVSNPTLALAQFTGELVSHGCGVTAIFDAAAMCPDDLYVQAMAAATCLLALTREGHVRADAYIAAMRKAAAHTRTDWWLGEAIVDWRAGRMERAVRGLRAHVEATPHDLALAKICQILELASGDIGGMRATAAHVALANPSCGYALGLYAFALEQSGDVEVGERYAQRALALNGDRNPWTQHAMAHVLHARGQHRDALAFLRAYAPTWRRCSSFMITHNWWHAALSAIELDDAESALDLFDRHVWGVRKAHPQDQINAISLLVRLELAGVDAGARWEDVGNAAAARCDDHAQDFADLHYAYALARTGRDAALANVLGKMRQPALGEAMAAHARGDFVRAAALFAAADRIVDIVGGSNVQRELFHLLRYDSVTRHDAGGQRRAL